METLNPGTGGKTVDTITSIGRDAAKDTRSDVHGAINRAADKVQPATDRLASSAHAAVDTLADKVPAAADKMAGAAHKATDRIADTADKVGGALEGKGAKMSAAYKQYMETGRGYVRSSPAVSVLVALAAGYGLSRLLGSRIGK